MNYQANTIIHTSSGRSAIEIKRENGYAKYCTVTFDRQVDGSLIFKCGDYVTPEKKITSILDDDLTILKDRV